MQTLTSPHPGPRFVLPHQGHSASEQASVHTSRQCHQVPPGQEACAGGPLGAHRLCAAGQGLGGTAEVRGGTAETPGCPVHCRLPSGIPVPSHQIPLTHVSTDTAKCPLGTKSAPSLHEESLTTAKYLDFQAGKLRPGVRVMQTATACLQASTLAFW